MKKRLLGTLFTALALVGCAGLDQFPDVSKNYDEALEKLDPGYSAALNRIYGITDNNGTPTAVAPADQKRIRNQEIDKRLAVIDANFKKFEIALAKQNVRADFGVSVLEIGIGGAGALVSESASQILSAVSSGLAGSKAAYSKAVLYEKALSALLAQMVASRNSVLVRIYQGRTRSHDDYPLSAAMHDLDAYYFAGSLPGAILGTSADASVKNDEAQKKIARLVVGPVPPDLQDRREQAADFVKTLNQTQLDQLAGALDLKTGAQALLDILTAISAAETAETFEVIAQQLKILFGKDV